MLRNDAKNLRIGTRMYNLNSPNREKASPTGSGSASFNITETVSQDAPQISSGSGSGSNPARITSKSKRSN